MSTPNSKLSFFSRKVLVRLVNTSELKMSFKSGCFFFIIIITGKMTFNEIQSRPKLTDKTKTSN